MSVIDRIFKSLTDKLNKNRHGIFSLRNDFSSITLFVLLSICAYIGTLFNAVPFLYSNYRLTLFLDTLKHGAGFLTVFFVLLIAVKSISYFAKGNKTFIALGLISASLVLILTVVHFADSYLMVVLRSRLMLGDLSMFFSGPKHIETVIEGNKITLLLMLLPVSIFCFLQYLSKSFKTILGTTLVFLSIHLDLGLLDLESYSPLKQDNIWSDITSGIGDIIDSRPADKVPLTLEFHQYKLPEVNLPVPGENVVVLMVEGFSTALSKKLGGPFDYVPEFDKRISQGTAFTNFFANFVCSEGALVGLTTGKIPALPPGHSGDMFSEYAKQPTVMETLKKEGYTTAYIQPHDLNFLNEKNFVNIKFDKAFGVNDVELFRNVKRYFMEAPADADVLKEALSRVDYLSKEKNPFFYIVRTMTSHPPLLDPENGDNTLQGVWRYVDKYVTKFIDNLESKNFFQNGILIVTGDHYHHLYPSAEESQVFGDSKTARIPLLVIGQGVPAGVINNKFFQQSDLFSMLEKALKTDSRLSPYPMLVYRQSFNLLSTNRGASFVVFDESNQGRQGYSGVINGGKVQWQTATPFDPSPIENRVLGEQREFLGNKRFG